MAGQDGERHRGAGHLIDETARAAHGGALWSPLLLLSHGEQMRRERAQGAVNRLAVREHVGRSQQLVSRGQGSR